MQKARVALLCWTSTKGVGSAMKLGAALLALSLKLASADECTRKYRFTLCTSFCSARCHQDSLHRSSWLLV